MHRRRKKIKSRECPNNTYSQKVFFSTLDSLVCDKMLYEDSFVVCFL